MSLVRLEITSAHLCLWTHTCTKWGLRSSNAGSAQAQPRLSPGVFRAVAASKPYVSPQTVLKRARVDEAGLLWPQSLPQSRPINGRSVLLPHNNRPHGNLLLLALFWTQTASRCLLFLPVSPSVYLLPIARPLCCSTSYAATFTYTHSLLSWRLSL